MKKIISTQGAPSAIGPYSQAVKVDVGSSSSGNARSDLGIEKSLVFTSGQIGIDPATGCLIQGMLEAEIKQAFLNLEAICKAAGGSFNHIVKLSLYLISMDDFSLVNQVMSELFVLPYPARSTVAVAALPKGARFEVEAILKIN